MKKIVYAFAGKKTVITLNLHKYEGAKILYITWISLGDEKYLRKSRSNTEINIAKNVFYRHLHVQPIMAVLKVLPHSEKVCPCLY